MTPDTTPTPSNAFAPAPMLPPTPPSPLAPGLHVVGHGPIRVLVVHGWIADHTLFAPYLAQVDPHGFTYALLDGRGYGTRLHEPGPCSIAAMAGELRAAARALGWPRFHVIGHSMGGMVAQRLLADCPDLLLSATLLAPVPASGARLDPARRALLERAIAEPEARRTLIDTNSGRARSAGWIDEVLQLSLRTTTPAALTAWFEAWSTTDFSRELRPVTVPVHVVAGELDPGAPRSRLEQTILPAFPHATLRSLPDIGHYPMRECPAELYAAITTAIARG